MRTRIPVTGETSNRTGRNTCNSIGRSKTHIGLAAVSNTTRHVLCAAVIMYCRASVVVAAAVGPPTSSPHECAAAKLSPTGARGTTRVVVGVATTPCTTAAVVEQSSAVIPTATRRLQHRVLQLLPWSSRPPQYQLLLDGYNTVYYSCCRGAVVSRNTNCY